MEIVDLFIGSALNAVDAKGRVSLPSSYRGTIERRQQRMAAPGGPLADKLVTFVSHDTRTCLIGFDAAYGQVMMQAVQARVAAAAAADPFAAMQDGQMDMFSATHEVSYDPSGRMCLPQHLRDEAGITDLAFFVPGGQIFQLWDPEAFQRECPELVKAQRQLTALLNERAAK